MFEQGHGTPADYKEVNMKESRDLADAFLAYKFLDGQYNFLKSKLHYSGPTLNDLAYLVQSEK